MKNPTKEEMIQFLKYQEQQSSHPPEKNIYRAIREELEKGR